MKWRPLSRRAFLGGAGTILPLPFLESLVPKRAMAAAPIQRAVFIFSPNGFVLDSIFPDKAGTDYKMPPTLAALEPLRAKISLPMHLDNSEGHFPGDHANGTACFLTNVRPKQTVGNDIEAANPSIDQLLVQSLGNQPTKYPYLNVGFAGTVGQGGGGAGDFGVSLAYINSVSWESTTKQLPFRQGPDKEFANLFAGSDPVASNSDKLKRDKYKKSVLDVNLAEANALKPKISKEDGIKLDRFMSGVSALEKRVTGGAVGGTAGGGMCGKRYPAPVRVPNTNYYGDWQKGWYQMIAMAFECDLTRVVTYMLGPGFSNQGYGFLGIGGAEYSADVQHHIISHNGGDPVKLGKLRKIDKFTFDNYAAFLGMLDKIDDGGGKTMLDNSAVYISSDIAHGDHGHTNYPVVLGGSAGGKLKTGGSYDFGSKKKQSELFTTILHAFGVNKNHADATGPISELLV